jgi:hypothetical protein
MDKTSVHPVQICLCQSALLATIMINGQVVHKADVDAISVID